MFWVQLISYSWFFDIFWRGQEKNIIDDDGTLSKNIFKINNAKIFSIESILKTQSEENLQLYPFDNKNKHKKE